MQREFLYDVFLSHSSRDAAEVRALADRLHRDGVRVWIDDWKIRPGDSIPAKIEEGLEGSRVLVLCMSANAFASEWARLEAGTFRFRDPLNKKRRFIPLRLDDAEVPGSLAQFLAISWKPEDQTREYPRLLEACAESPKPADEKETPDEHLVRKGKLSLTSPTSAYALSRDATQFLTGSGDGRLRLWDLSTRSVVRALSGHTEEISTVLLSASGQTALSGSYDNTLRLWNVRTGECLRVFRGHTNDVMDIAWSSDERQALSASRDSTVRMWDIETGQCTRILRGHSREVWSVELHDDASTAFSGSVDGTIRVWDLNTGESYVMNEHSDAVAAIAWNTHRQLLASAGFDNTIRLWNPRTRRCLRVMEGHTHAPLSLSWSHDEQYLASAGEDRTIRVWNAETGECVRVFTGHSNAIWSLLWSSDGKHLISGSLDVDLRIWDASDLALERPVVANVQYTNAKVLLVGESGAGKTGLSKRLALNEWQPTDSTVGAWATHWKLPVESSDGIEREIWLWDFGGQADQRLIHQLYMDETALAVVVFDGQKDDVFETLGQWDRDLTRASRRPFMKLLVAGRVDAGGIRVSRVQLDAFRKERGYLELIETSAKTNAGCERLRKAVLDGIQWEEIPWRSSPLLFRLLKEEIIQIKDAGRVLMRFNELREMLHLRLAGRLARFTDDELKAVIGLLAGPGVVWELNFGSWVLLQPERINAYAQAVIQTMRSDEQERGCLPEEKVLEGNLTYQSAMERLDAEEERFVLLAMHQTLVERGLCLREHTENGPLLVFPSYYRRERPDLVGHPAMLVTYRFHGSLDEIYATLVVRLHHTKPFQQDQLWRYAADFKTLTGKQLGVKLTRRAEGAGELEVYFDPSIPMEEKIIFSKYVHEHLLQNSSEVVRLRHYVCPHCGTPVGNREVAMERLAEGKRDIGCLRCDDPGKRVPLWDELEELFASDEVKHRVLELQNQSKIVLDNESRERALVGEVISTVALAGQISRELHVRDHGIDMEIEFKSDDGEATGCRVYLQLKSGGRDVAPGKAAGVELFSLNERQAHDWESQAIPVLIVMRNSQGDVRWMDVRDYLRHAEKPTEHVEFKGERFDVMSVRRWRERVLAECP